ncbi:MAG: hypothetical protein ACOCZ7_00780 [Armatimonadota bacterium]
MAEREIRAVLTGDIVLSARFAESGPAISSAIKDAYRAGEDAFEGALTGVDVFRGDSWQVLVNSPAHALRVALLMRALIRSRKDLPNADTRVAIGIGEVTFVDPHNVSESQGEAFRLSGEALESLSRSSVHMAAVIPAEWVTDTPSQLLRPQETLDTVMILLDAICGSWTAVMAETVAGALRGWTQERIGDERGVTQSTASRVLSSAKWSAVEQALDWWEHSIRYER